jgi:hypothetical protein
MADKGTALQEKITKQEQKIAAVRADIARLGTKGPGAAPKMGRLADKLKVLLATLDAWLAAQASTTTKPDQATEVQAP